MTENVRMSDFTYWQLVRNSHEGYKECWWAVRSVVQNLQAHLSSLRYLNISYSNAEVERLIDYMAKAVTLIDDVAEELYQTKHENPDFEDLSKKLNHMGSASTYFGEKADEQC